MTGSILLVQHNGCLRVKTHGEFESEIRCFCCIAAVVEWGYFLASRRLAYRERGERGLRGKRICLGMNKVPSARHNLVVEIVSGQF